MALIIRDYKIIIVVQITHHQGDVKYSTSIRFRLHIR